MKDAKTMKRKEKIKICFAASTGGHYEQLMMLKPLMEKYDSFVVTEKTEYSAKARNEKTYFMKQVNRREKDFLLKMLINFFKRKTRYYNLYRSISNDSYLSDF